MPPKRRPPHRVPEVRPLYIETDPSIGAALKFDGMNVEDFIDRKRAQIEGLIAGAGALIEVDRVEIGWNALCQAASTSEKSLSGLEPIRIGEPHKVAGEMLQSALLALLELYGVAQAVAAAFRTSRPTADKY